MRIKYDESVKQLTDCQNRLSDHKSEHKYFYDIEHFFGNSYDIEGYLENTRYEIIDEIAQEVTEICNSVFPGPNENNYPFNKSWIGPAKFPNTDQKQFKWISHKMYLLTLFIERKLKKIKLYSDVDDMPKENLARDFKPQTNITHVEQYVAGNSINITNITTTLQNLKKKYKMNQI